MTTVTVAQIDAATDALALQRLQAKVQLEQAAAYEAELQNVAAERAAAAAARAESARHNAALEAIFTRQVAAVEASQALFRQQATAFDASERGEVMRKVFETLLPGVVKPSSATTPDGKLADARADAEWLRIQVEQVMATYDVLRTPPVV